MAADSNTQPGRKTVLVRRVSLALSVAMTTAFTLVGVGCGRTSGPILGAGRVPAAWGAKQAEKREIPLTPGVPELGQQAVLPRDPALDGTVQFNLLYTNDIHSRIDPFPQNFYYSFYAGKGGFGRLTTAIRDFKSRFPNTLAVDSGDYLQGTPYFNFFKGEAEMRLMDAAGFDAITIGNHEFDNGVTQLQAVLPHYKGALITTNMTFDRELGIRYAVKKVGAVRVGMFALITEVNGLVSAPNFQGARYYDPVKTAAAAVAKLRKEADAVVLLSHMGSTPPWSESDTRAPETELAHDHEVEPEQITDEVLAKRVPGIDVIISGHTHVMIKRPLVVRQPGGGATHIISSGMGGGYLGQATLTLERGRVTRLVNAMLPLTGNVPAAPDVERIITPYREVVNRSIGQEIGEATGVFKRYGTNDVESSLNNLIADACLAAARKLKAETAFAVMSSGTPRNPLPQGRLKVEDCFYALPFDNRIVLMQVTGKQAIDMLTIQRRPTDHKRHAIANASYTLLRNAGPIEDARIGGQPIDPNAKYWVAVNDYMADGSSGFTMLPGCPRQNTTVLQRDALIDHIRAKGTVTPEIGRITVKNRP
ncbi:MAG: bifunctional UDP-sugar hydrolase/5'-nucleotidase [Candidatus Sericytochromatia bacterium]|nr:bifunctional UDP-sugar hydrolase/5'-nucleotidase [Candidatus Sericytochromatia bacterium]